MSLVELTRGLSRFSSPPETSPRRLDGLQALVLLGGAMRSSPLSEATRRSPLDLPIDETHSIMDLWQAHAIVLAAHLERDHLPVRVITNGIAPMPSNEEAISLSIERDPSEMRGTGGVLHDIAQDYPDESFIVVANAAQIFYDALPNLLTNLSATHADVALVANDDGAASSLFLARCGSLRVIPRIGYVDMKEQALPLIARESVVKVIHRPHATGLPVRTLKDYIRALRRYHRRGPLKNAFEENWSPLFSIIESGAHVDATAQLHDSVVLSGGVVEAGALVARSVVCSGGVVKKNQFVLDRLVVGK
jgi:hypothetical protein